MVVFDTNMTDAQKASICDKLGVSCIHCVAMQVQSIVLCGIDTAVLAGCTSIASATTQVITICHILLNGLFMACNERLKVCQDMLFQFLDH